jgi:hypothetical protein
VTSEKEVALATIDIAARLKLILMGVAANRATEVPKELRLLLESFQFS